MKKVYYLFIFFLLSSFFSVGLKGQELRVITEDFKIPKDSCKIYAYDFEAFLKSKGLYEELPTPKDKEGDIELVKNKLQIGGTDFTKDCAFIVELKRAYSTPDGEYYGDFLIIELGFTDKSKATRVFDQAETASKKYPLNIPLYAARFKCAQVENSVLLVCSFNYYLRKYRDMVEGWQPGKE